MDTKQIFHGPYEIEALGNVLISSRNAECHIQCTGMQSHLLLESEWYATISCGSAMLNMSNLPDPQGQIVLSTAATGSILQTVGTSAAGGPAFKLSPGMITLSVGLPGQEASISLTPLSVEIKIGATSLTLTPAGCKIQAGPETTLNVGVEGLTESGLMKKADFKVSDTENGGAITQIKGAIVKIN